MTETLPSTEESDQLAMLDEAAEQTWMKLCAVREQKRQIDALEKELCGQLRAALGRGKFTPPGGGPILSIGPTRKFDPTRAEQILPAPQLSLVQRLVVDAKLAKEKLPPELYAICQVESNNDTVRAL